MRRPRHGLLRLLVLSSLVAASLGLAACGDDSDSAGEPATSPVTVTETETVTGATTGTTSATTDAGGEAEVDPITQSLQEDLRELGFYKGEITGEYDAETTAAVKAFQLSAALAQDGIAGAQTHLAIDFELGRSSAETVKLLQQDLASLCHYSGPINGVYTSATEAAVREFQKSAGLTIDGRFGPQTAISLVREGEFAPSSCASTPATPAATHTGPSEPAATITVSGPAYSKTFEVTKCTPKGETGATLNGTASGGFTITLVVPSRTGTLTIGGGNEQDGINLTGAVRELSVGDAGDLRGRVVFTPRAVASGRRLHPRRALA